MTFALCVCRLRLRLRLMLPGAAEKADTIACQPAAYTMPRKPVNTFQTYVLVPSVGRESNVKR